ncbi:hypothetical protein CKO45_28235 [Paracraurococcus ruber]|uniref:Uncharacterized protein n=3 Tax=Paracraurococcus ruber TaxID=77675 RepID=A0ABS1D6I3_9PROT|nr:hypothetical protein [Paracraurococcus ruber]
MPRIAREEYPRILAMVDGEGMRVAEVATAYGCTPANIYAILSKARQMPAGTGSAPMHPSPSALTHPGTEKAAEAPAAGASDPVLPPPADLFDDAPRRAEPRAADAADGACPGMPTKADGGPDAPVLETSTPGLTAAAPKPAAAGSTPARTAREVPAAATMPRSGARVGKGRGVALLMRTSDGEEAVHPFRSLEDLLSASKPILRSAVRSPEPIWFSVQEVELEAVAAEDF